jgi:hypothetical protein
MGICRKEERNSRNGRMTDMFSGILAGFLGNQPAAGDQNISRSMEVFRKAII